MSPFLRVVESRLTNLNLQRDPTCQMVNGCGTPRHAKVAAFYGDRYTMPVNGAYKPCMGRCGTNMMKAPSFYPPLRKLPPSPRMSTIDSDSSHMTWMDTTFHQIGTCGLQVMHQR